MYLAVTVIQCLDLPLLNHLPLLASTGTSLFSGLGFASALTALGFSGTLTGTGTSGLLVTFSLSSLPFNESAIIALPSEVSTNTGSTNVIPAKFSTA